MIDLSKQQIIETAKEQMAFCRQNEARAAELISVCPIERPQDLKRYTEDFLKARGGAEALEFFISTIE
jgi:hypothetical protein